MQSSRLLLSWRTSVRESNPPRLVSWRDAIQQYIELKALHFGPTLTAVMLTALGILFVLVGLILSAIGEMVTNGRGKRFNGIGCRNLNRPVSESRKI